MNNLQLISVFVFISFLTAKAQVTNSFPDNGNVGIGTTSPSSKLHIKDPFGGSAMDIERGGKKWNISIQNTGNNLFINNSLNPSFFFTFANTGRFGIGTTSPQYMVHAKKSTGISEVRTESYDHYAKMGTNDGGGYFGASNGNGELTINIRGYGDAYFNAGNVGIGTTSPDAKLTVKGDIHAEEVKVDLSVPGPDYVFKEDYNLKSLEEVQDYIKENGHLPNIPSALEMEENGIQLGEMNMKLLEKIEELTLYMIELKKENTAMRTELNQIKNTLN